SGLRCKVALFSELVVRFARRTEDRFGGVVLSSEHLGPCADRITLADEETSDMELFVDHPSTRQHIAGLVELPPHRDEPAEENKDSRFTDAIRTRPPNELLTSTDRVRSGNRAVIQRSRNLRTADRRRPSGTLVVLHG